MKPRFRCRALAALLVLALLPACAATPDADGHKGGVIHVVLVWLKAPGNAAHRQQIIDGSHGLAEIPGVLDLRVGEVVPSDRKVVEASYDVGIMLRFASIADLQSYLDHPIHVNTVKQQFLPIIDRYQVMDFRDR